MYEFHIGRVLGKYLALCCVVGSAVCGVSVSAQTDASWPYTTNGNQTTYTKAGMNARFNSHFVWDIDPDGKLRASSTSQAPLSGGKKIPVGMKSILPNLTAAGVIAKQLARYAGPLGVGIALWDLAQELDYDLSRGPDGGVVVTQNGQPEQRRVSCQAGTITGSVQYLRETCAAAYTIYWRDNGYGACVVSAGTGGGTNVTTTAVNCGGNGVVDIPTGFVSAGTASSTASISDLADKIASQSGWPSNSNLPNAVRDAAAADIPFELPAPNVSGPATSPGTTTTTVNNLGDTITTTTTNHHTYEGAKITTNTTTVTTVVTSAGTTTTTTESEAENPEVDQCEKNPQSIACATADVPEHDVPKRQVDVSFAAEDLGFGGGSCPAPVSFDVTTGHYELSFSKWCDAVTTWVRPLVIALATLMAFMIAWPRSES